MDTPDAVLLELCMRKAIPITQSKVPLKQGYQYIQMPRPEETTSFHACEHNPTRVSIVAEIVTYSPERCRLRWGGMIADPDGPITFCPRCGGYLDTNGQWHSYHQIPDLLLQSQREMEVFDKAKERGSEAIDAEALMHED
jgi:hypothetical protein